jgi:MFS family permease
MALAGAGAGISELTALAATSELAPTAKRGTYIALMISSLLLFCPSTLWAQLISTHSSWRFVGLLSALWSFIGFLLVTVFYFPPPRVNSLGLSRRDIITQIDIVGGMLSISGIILFIGGLVWGGNQVYTRLPHL